MIEASICQNEHGEIQVSGDLNDQSVMALLEQGQQLILKQPEVVIVNLQEVKQVKSSACALLIEWLSFARRQGKNLSFIHIPENLSALISINGLAEILMTTEEEHG